MAYNTQARNPKNDNMTPGDMGQQQPVQSQSPRQPKSIRDYLANIREQQAMAGGAGITPRFTNQPQSPGFIIDERPTQQAIPEGPQSDYESEPFMDRVKRDPYKRAQQRVRDFLPELWQATFPGMAQGAILDQNQMQHWQKAVGALTSRLLKRFDSQYEVAMKQEYKDRDRRENDKRFWQAKYQDNLLKGMPPQDLEGNIIDEATWVKARIDTNDEMKFKEEVTKRERNVKTATESMSNAQVKEAMRTNPTLAKAINDQIRTFVEDGLKRKLTDQEYASLFENPAARDLLETSAREAVDYYSDQLMESRGIPSGMDMSD